MADFLNQYSQILHATPPLQNIIKELMLDDVVFQSVITLQVYMKECLLQRVVVLAVTARFDRNPNILLVHDRLSVLKYQIFHPLIPQNDLQNIPLVLNHQQFVLIVKNVLGYLLHYVIVLPLRMIPCVDYLRHYPLHHIRGPTGQPLFSVF